ncbi:hypothetical protein [Ferrimicrobium sp.]|uniref:ATP-grasp domain-containing protein n=1 Tax=Ferrimicrobium sp. TaxID=2926050 RepID=UPI002631036D|nr:hypothetical protein [Ferrimicrobium sp.]
MTRILLLQQPASTSPLDRWIIEADPSTQITMVTGKDHRRDLEDMAPGTQIVTVDDYFSDEATGTIMDVARDLKPDRVLCNAEDDVVRAGTLRSLLSIQGTTASLAMQFRDKLRMKRIFHNAALTAVRWVDCQSVDDLFAASDQFGAIVLKPRAGAGSKGIRIFEDKETVIHAVAKDPALLASLHQHALIAEEYVAGDVFHTDAVLDGVNVLLASVSRYVYPPHTFQEHPVMSVMVDSGSRDAQDMYECTEAIAQSLPEDHGIYLIHLETYRRPTGELLAGEIAARLGGGMIKASISRAYGVDLSKESYLLGAGLRHASVLASQPTPPKKLTVGQVLWTSTDPGLSEEVLPEWASGYWSKPIRPEEHAVHSTDAFGGVLVDGKDEVEVIERMVSLA